MRQTNISKTVRVGTVLVYGNKKADLFCKAEITEGKLSIVGVIGPKRNGDAEGSHGQICMGFWHRNSAHNDKRYDNPTKPEEISFAPDWNADLWLRFLEIWHDWHLNDMKAGCEHQTGPEWDTQKQLTTYFFRLTETAEAGRKWIEKRALEAARKGEFFRTTPDQVRLLNLPRERCSTQPTLPDDIAPDYQPNGPQYKGDHYNEPSKTENAGWVRHDEHPDGLLGKPCPVCGYKYGSEWRKRDLPQDVIDFIAALPDTDKQPAWI
jgi:hypothetical protein